MAVYAISDLHLALGMDKPMNIFGDLWENHELQIANAWKSIVTPMDTIIIPGDISWAMTLEQGIMDFEFINNLPGTKIILKGNHDYWWSSVTKIENYFSENKFSTIKLLKNNSFRVDDTTLLCGTRGWVLPCENAFKQKDEVVYNRELGRLKCSLDSAKKVMNENDRIIVAFHYPPLLNHCLETDFTKMLEEYEVELCIFGHIHGNGSERSYEGCINGVKYKNASADKLGFKPIQL